MAKADSTRAKIRGIFLNVILIFASLAVTLVAAEGAARLVYSSLGAPHWTHRDFRMMRPAPYADAAYFSEQFIRESFEQPGGHTIVPGTRIVLPNAFAGRWFNVVESKRVTIGAPREFGGRVLVFGGSTIYCSEVPDAFTLPSALQARLEAAARGRFAVENYGVTSVNSRQQLERLRTVDVGPGDVVVFYDGVNDIFNAVLFGRPDGWIIGENQNVLATLPPWRAWLVRRAMRLSERFYLFRPLIEGGQLTLPPAVADPGQLAVNLDAMEQDYVRTIAAARDYVEAKGARFVHFVQPNLFAKPALSDYEQSLLRMPQIVVPGSELAFRAGTPRLVRASESLRAQGVDSNDLTTILNRQPTGREYFLDAMHVAHEGNAVVADAISRQILTK